MIYRGRGAFINIGKAKDNFNKNRLPKCFNCNTYRYIAKKYQKPKRERETRKYYKYNKVRYFAKGCRSGQKMKNKSVQEDSDKESNNKQECFIRGLEQV